MMKIIITILMLLAIAPAAWGQTFGDEVQRVKPDSIEAEITPDRVLYMQWQTPTAQQGGEPPRVEIYHFSTSAEGKVIPEFVFRVPNLYTQYKARLAREGWYKVVVEGIPYDRTLIASRNAPRTKLLLKLIRAIDGETDAATKVDKAERAVRRAVRVGQAVRSVLR